MDDSDGSAPTVRDHERPLGSPPSQPPRLADTRYTLRTLLGRGGMGEVWLAQDGRVEREVAIKLMRTDAAHDSESIARFLREARVQGRLDHPAIPPVHDLGSDERAPYFAMKRLSGATLESVISSRAAGDALTLEAWPRATLLARFVDACFAIELAHQRGVVHRDIKPGNIMLGDFGETYVLDWGLARVDGVPDARIASDEVIAHDGLHTAAGTQMGTPGYMAPEQQKGQTVDHRADIFALGCVLFEILAGARAIQQSAPTNAPAVAAPPTCYRPSTRNVSEPVPPELDDLCARATAAKPSERVASARELAESVQKYLDGDRDLARRIDLAATHTAAAEKCLTAGADGDEAARAEAMREAGRAIALDPTNARAQQLLARLLLEPPRDIPAGARREIDAERAVARHHVLRTAAYTYTGNLILLPLTKLIGVTGSWPFLVVAGLLVLQIAACLRVSRRAGPLRKGDIAVLAGLHFLLLAIVAVCFGPLLAGPAFAFGALPITLLFPSIRMPKSVFALHALAIVLPLGLEVAQILPATTHVASDGSLALKPWAVTASPAVIAGLVLCVLVLQMIVCTVLVDRARGVQESAQERVHVTAWHLRKLVG